MREIKTLLEGWSATAPVTHLMAIKAQPLNDMPNAERRVTCTRTAALWDHYCRGLPEENAKNDQNWKMMRPWLQRGVQMNGIHLNAGNFGAITAYAQRAHGPRSLQGVLV